MPVFALIDILDVVCRFSLLHHDDPIFFWRITCSLILMQGAQKIDDLGEDPGLLLGKERLLLGQMVDFLKGDPPFLKLLAHATGVLSEQSHQSGLSLMLRLQFVLFRAPNSIGFDAICQSNETLFDVSADRFVKRFFQLLVADIRQSRSP